MDAWNEYYHTDVVVIGSAYRYGDYFIVINYEEDLSNYPKKLKKWIAISYLILQN